MTIDVGLLGLGNVGTGVAKYLLQYGDSLGLRLKPPVVVRYSVTKTRDVDILLGYNPYKILDDPDVKIVVELMGGEHPAKDLILSAVQRGKSVVTANKTVISRHAKEIFNAARGKADVAYEGSVGGGIQIISTMQRLRGERIHKLIGIVNGTTNYILTKMHQGMTFDSGLEEAQRLGYAEADPAKDISGEDAREKLAILAMLLYNTEVKPDDILCDGLQDIRSDEIRRVRDLRYILKPLVMAKYYNGCAELRVHPTLIGQDHRLASIDGVENAIFWEGELCGPQMYRGKGAGRDATTSAVISDMLHVADNIKRGVVDELPTLNSGIRIRDKADVKMSGYLMVTLKDVPGARDAVTDIASKHEVNMIQLLQREQDRFEAADGKRFAQMELTMFQTEYHKLEAVLRELGGLNEFVLGKPMLLKLEE